MLTAIFNDREHALAWRHLVGCNFNNLEKGFFEPFFESINVARVVNSRESRVIWQDVPHLIAQNQISHLTSQISNLKIRHLPHRRVRRAQSWLSVICDR